jgi:large subunit ribosomal protein L17
MAASLILEERIVTTKQKAKVLKTYSEKMITRAKRNLVLGENELAKKVHNKREVLKDLSDRNAVAKLFDDIAVRNKDRKGGYTRIILLDRRDGDAAERAIIEFVEKKAKAEKKEPKKEVKKDAKKEKEAK